jgi:predicted ABC-type transport system involved in lysophospholipase L1 biosynthesis ATPase subunit
VVVLDDVWLQVDAGEAVGVWGMRRSGKSTLLRVAAGIEPVDGGSVRFDGRDLAALGARERAQLWRREIALVSAASSGAGPVRPSRAQSVLDHVALPLMAQGWTLDEATTRAFALLERAGAADCVEATTVELSPGEATRVAVARAMIRSPRLLLVDEPAVTPSPSERDEIRALLLSLTREAGAALLVASEEVGALRGCDRVVAISDGRLAAARAGAVVPFPRTQTGGGGSGQQPS